MKSTLANFPSRQASGIGYDRAVSPNDDARDRPTIVSNDGIMFVFNDYDGLAQHPTVTTCRNFPTFTYLTASDQFSSEITREMPILIADNPINYTDALGMSLWSALFGPSYHYVDTPKYQPFAVELTGKNGKKYIVYGVYHETIKVEDDANQVVEHTVFFFERFVVPVCAAHAGDPKFGLDFYRRIANRDANGLYDHDDYMSVVNGLQNTINVLAIAGIAATAAVGGEALDAVLEQYLAAEEGGAALDAGANVVDAAESEGAGIAAEESSGARFIADENGNIVDTQSTPPGSYDQPNGGRTDILQQEDHGAGYSHTHDPILNTNPNTGETFINGTQQPGRPVSPEDISNIQSGAATPSAPKGR